MAEADGRAGRATRVVGDCYHLEQALGPFPTERGPGRPPGQPSFLAAQLELLVPG